jgi:hypothetical protein
MDELHATANVIPLRDWPDERIERVFGLLSRSLTRRLEASEDPGEPDIVQLRGECELFGMELVRRGRL